MDALFTYAVEHPLAFLIVVLICFFTLCCVGVLLLALLGSVRDDEEADEDAEHLRDIRERKEGE